MHYTGKDSKVEWTGKVSIEQSEEILVGHKRLCVTVENETGVPFIVIGVGAVVPDNWVGERVKITVEKL